MQKRITLVATDQTEIAAHLFSPELNAEKVLVINGATGVRQFLYFHFAEYLAQHGITVLTYDYRGIGLSKPHSIRHYKASMQDWGSLDFTAVTAFVKKEFSTYRKYILGHSIGTTILGMNPDAKDFDQFIFVSGQDAQLRNLNFRTRLEGILGFGIARPLLTALLGYFPAPWFGLGQPLPSGCAKDWATLILNKRSIAKLLAPYGDLSKELTQKTLILSAEDDLWITERGVDALLTETFPKLKATKRILRTEESPRHLIGHVNFFRRFNKKLWKIVLDQLTD